MEETTKELANSIEDLAVMIKNGFDAVDEKMDGQFKEVNGRLEKIENRLDNVAYRFEINELDKRVKVLESKVK